MSKLEFGFILQKKKGNAKRENQEACEIEAGRFITRHPRRLLLLSLVPRFDITAHIFIDASFDASRGQACFRRSKDGGCLFGRIKTNNSEESPQAGHWR
jgi:hypothetical protein